MKKVFIGTTLTPPNVSNGHIQHSFFNLQYNVYVTVIVDNILNNIASRNRIEVFLSDILFGISIRQYPINPLYKVNVNYIGNW